MHKLFQVADIAVGTYDERNFFTAEVRKGGKGAKDEGADRFHLVTYHPNLGDALRRCITRVAQPKITAKLEDYVAAVEEVLDKAEKTIVRLGLDKVRPNDKVSV